MLTRRTLLTGLVAAAALGRGETPWCSPDAAVAATNVPISSVLELFTSQGCSSCPAADALLAEFAARPGILALTFPVDLWDYLGWRDTLASPKFAKRQRYYAKARGDGQVYTPQVIVNGGAHVNGSDRGAIERTLTTPSGLGGLTIPVSIRPAGAHLIVEAGAATTNSARDEFTLWVAAVTRRVEVAVRRGENAGKTLAYANVVRDAAALGMWSGQPLAVRLDPATLGQAEADAVAVVLQRGMSGPIIGATWHGLR
jgi:hypothetical protein